MEINDVIRLMQAVSEQGLTSFRLEDGDIKLSIKKEKQMVIAAEGDFVQRSLEIPAYAGQETKTLENGMDPEKAEILATDKVVSSPLVGTFYNASSPDSPPFVKAGDTVKKGQTLGIIEAMKLMNEIECEYDGVVEAVLVGNEDVVEYGQPLFRIR
ncbi:acetyl-CoA carboxylase biotin carboxyl carrier protein [Clostridium boliviensis]|uniref:Biotin carboxyl carrier protein of acetyl-CoA carboxylase n=1 Tax=Clostridium boliviensis TaxID=318465 RepID=A0ABU4GHJ5_9CLOT|nr:acetyl-CoA carboxylase biotin carboxyl carrier protein [Clostridium boliviensis]MDW2797095.1 acetyl-CoA carboxylase biotin carboxyl carrier protein [Clostridium boliviensis]